MKRAVVNAEISVCQVDREFKTLCRGYVFNLIHCSWGLNFKDTVDSDPYFI